MHNDFVREDGQWPPESVPTARDWALFDRAQSKGLNLSGGNAWAPSAPLVIGGAGLVLSGTGQWIQGSVRTERGGRLALASNHPLVTPTRTRTVRVSFGAALRSSASVPNWVRASSPIGVRITSVSTATLSLPIPSARLHSGASLTSATLYFRVGQPHAALPTSFLTLNLRAYALGHQTSAPLYSGGFGGYAVFAPAPGTPDGYFAGGGVQTLTLACNQNNVIDPAAFTYVADIQDERGTNALPGNVYHSLELHFSNITDLRPE